jgi:FkbM family methyltransferase
MKAEERKTPVKHILSRLGLGRLWYQIYHRPMDELSRWLEGRKYPDRETLVSVRDFSMWVLSPRRNLVGRALVECGIWEPEATDCVVREVKKGMTVIDIGADMGYYSLLFSKLVGREGQVHSFEPIPRAREILKKNQDENSIHNLSIYPFALGKQAGRMILEKPFESSRLAPTKSEKSFDDIEVEIRVFDSLDGISKVDFVKIDVEGAEYVVLLGMEKSIRQYHPKILIEVHPRMLPLFGESTESLFCLIRELGYQDIATVGNKPNGDDNYFIICR